MQHVLRFFCTISDLTFLCVCVCVCNEEVAQLNVISLPNAFLKHIFKLYFVLCVVFRQ